MLPAPCADDCFRSNESWHVQNDMLVSDPVPCAQPGVSFGGLLKNDKDEGELPKCTSKATAWGGGAGTPMSCEANQHWHTAQLSCGG